MATILRFERLLGVGLLLSCAAAAVQAQSPAVTRVAAPVASGVAAALKPVERAPAVPAPASAAAANAQAASAGRPAVQASATAQARPKSTRLVCPNPNGQTWWVKLEDQTVRQTLVRWAEFAGWQLVWEADRDFPIEAEAKFEGTLRCSVEILMRSLADTDYPVRALMNNDSKVIRIQRYGVPQGQ